MDDRSGSELQASVLDRPAGDEDVDERGPDPNEPLILDEIVIDELSIDGMCGVY